MKEVMRQATRSVLPTDQVQFGKSCCMILVWLFPMPSKERSPCGVRNQERRVVTAATVRRKSRREHGEGRRGHRTSRFNYRSVQRVPNGSRRDTAASALRQICACMQEVWNQARSTTTSLLLLVFHLDSRSMVFAGRPST